MKGRKRGVEKTGAPPGENDHPDRESTGFILASMMCTDEREFHQALHVRNFPLPIC